LLFAALEVGIAVSVAPLDNVSFHALCWTILTHAFSVRYKICLYIAKIVVFADAVKVFLGSLWSSSTPTVGTRWDLPLSASLATSSMVTSQFHPNDDLLALINKNELPAFSSQANSIDRTAAT
jgi:hypothetical protein